MRFLTLHTSGTIRLRLTLWYGGLFFLAGVILLLANFVLVSQNFPAEHDDFRDRAAQRLGIPPDVFAPGGNIEFPARPPRPGGENRLTLVRVGVFFDEIGAQLKAETLEQLVWQSTLLLSVMSMTSVGVGWWIAGRMLRPLTEITDTVRRISDESLYERVRLTGPHDELRELADQFDVMLERLESAFRAQRNFVSDASHELRTPLTVIRTEVDVSLTGGDATADEQRHVAEVVRSAIARSEALIEALLILARADALLGSAETLSLVALSNQVLDSRATEVEAAGLRLERELAAIDVIGDRVLLERLIDNLVQNAIVHNERGGWLRVTTSQEADEACLVVSNSGVRIGATEVERLFKRFQRGDESRSRGKETAAVSGYGLGLSIVRAVAEHHGGKATAHALLDGGLEVTVRFPR